MLVHFRIDEVQILLFNSQHDNIKINLFLPTVLCYYIVPSYTLIKKVFRNGMIAQFVLRNFTEFSKLKCSDIKFDMH